MINSLNAFNKFSMGIGVIGGFISGWLGGTDHLLITLITLIVIDYLTGLIKAIYTKQLSSEIGYKGIVRKILMLLIVGFAVALQEIILNGVPLREITILFFITNEGLSIIENAAEVIPLPKQLKEILLQIRNKEDKNTEKDEDVYDDKNKK